MMTATLARVGNKYFAEIVCRDPQTGHTDYDKPIVRIPCNSYEHWRLVATAYNEDMPLLRKLVTGTLVGTTE